MLLLQIVPKLGERMYYGSHVSIRDGYLEAAKTALKLGGKAFQYFPKNPRSLAVKPFDRRDAEQCAHFCELNGLLSIAHTPYPTNLAAEDPGIQQATVQSLINDLQIADACKSVGVVVHFGKYKGKTPLQGYKNILQCLNEVLSEWQGGALLLIENQAGQGEGMGTTLEELVQIRGLASYPDKIGFCFDTCHAFASGLWQDGKLEKLVENGKKLGYIGHLKAVHLNDSAYPSGSHRDRHANVGQGYIGEAAMRQFLALTELNHIPIVLETPQSKQYSHLEEIAYLKTVRS